MLPEILGISVPAELLALAPSTYTGFSAHAETVKQKKLDRQQQQADEEAGEGKVKSSDDGQGDSRSDEMTSRDDLRLTNSCEMSTTAAADSTMNTPACD